LTVLATKTSQNLLTGDNTGIMGLGFETIASTEATPFWELLEEVRTCVLGTGNMPLT
jgi:hypothetical protein